jgi:hypothetical protein
MQITTTNSIRARKKKGIREQRKLPWTERKRRQLEELPKFRK